MQQVFNFIFKNSYRLLFLLLLGTSLFLTIQYHSFHKSKIISSANFLTGSVYEKMNLVSQYFSLKEQNDALAIENARLKKILFNKTDSVNLAMVDSVPGVIKTDVIISKVIHNPYMYQKNYLTINSGEKDGVKVDMGVINDLGIIGIVEKTSENYATVQSILNINSKINARIKKSNHFGTLIWNGKNTGYVQLIDVPRLASVRKGDTVVTGSESKIFPANINIGVVDKVYEVDETNYYELSIRLFNDMTNLGYIYIIKNKDRDEILNIEQTIKKNE
jgi:rod shape-determining protein MreC